VTSSSTPEASSSAPEASTKATVAAAATIEATASTATQAYAAKATASTAAIKTAASTKVTSKAKNSAIHIYFLHCLLYCFHICIVDWKDNCNQLSKTCFTLMTIISIAYFSFGKELI
jgi:hypothetical protein